MTVVDQVSPKERVGKEHPRPARRPHQEEGDGRGDDPAEDEDDLATEAVGESSGEVVCAGLVDSKDNDEGEDGGLGFKMELGLGDGRERVRSIPTIAPTSALTTTSKLNCARFSRSPRRSAALPTGGALMTRLAQPRAIRAPANPPRPAPGGVR